jgi:hypothetical protein
MVSTKVHDYMPLGFGEIAKELEIKEESFDKKNFC